MISFDVTFSRFMALSSVAQQFRLWKDRIGGRGGLCCERWVGGRCLPPHPNPLPWGGGAPKQRSIDDKVHRSNARCENVEALHKPRVRNETTTSSPRPSPPVEEREKATCVHGHNAHSSNFEALHEPSNCADRAQPFQGCG